MRKPPLGEQGEVDCDWSVSGRNKTEGMRESRVFLSPQSPPQACRLQAKIGKSLAKKAPTVYTILL